MGVLSPASTIFVLALASREFVSYSITVIGMNELKALIEGFPIATSFISRSEGALPVHTGKGNGASQVYVTLMRECTRQACILDSNEMRISHGLTWMRAQFCAWANVSQITGLFPLTRRSSGIQEDPC